MDIQNPRRVLVIGAPNSGVLTLLKELTGSAPEQTSATTAGLTHEWSLETKYYTATLPIWVDELPDVTEWRAEFTRPEAREVVTVLGAWIYCFRKPVGNEDIAKIKETMQAIADVIERACGFSSDMVCLAVAMQQSITPYLDKSAEDWEEIFMDYNFEFVDFEATGKNEFGEAMGVQRVRQALEAAEWEGDAPLDFNDEEGFEGSFAAEEAEINMELFGMKGALHGLDREGNEAENEELEVEELESMMQRMIAIKEMGEGMEDEQRKRFAAKAVRDLLKDF